MPEIPDQLADRALGALTGLALGDALGMPTQSMSHTAIATTFGRITGLVDATADQPIAPNMPAGSITDDTEQALLVADLLVRGHGHIDPRDFADALATWERTMAAKGSLDLLGPSTKAAIAAIQDGVDPTQAGRRGTTNGAAMRITPVGIAFAPGPEGPNPLLEAVIEASQVTHNTGLGLASAAAVAAAISSGLDGADARQAATSATTLARQAQTRGSWMAGGSIAARIDWAVQTVQTLPEDEAVAFVRDVVGTSVVSQESVVAAFALAARFDHDPWRAVCEAASIGGDTDTIACICGAMLGARHGTSVWPEDAVAQVVRVNQLDLPAVATSLLTLRQDPDIPARY